MSFISPKVYFKLNKHNFYIIYLKSRWQIITSYVCIIQISVIYLCKYWLNYDENDKTNLFFNQMYMFNKKIHIYFSETKLFFYFVNSMF